MILSILSVAVTVPAWSSKVGECDSCITRRFGTVTDPNNPPTKIGICWPDDEGTIPDCEELVIDEIHANLYELRSGGHALR